MEFKFKIIRFQRISTQISLSGKSSYNFLKSFYLHSGRLCVHFHLELDCHRSGQAAGSDSADLRRPGGQQEDHRQDHLHQSRLHRGHHPLLSSHGGM